MDLRLSCFWALPARHRPSPPCHRPETAAPLGAPALLTVQWKANASCADLAAAFDVRLEKLRAANDKANAAGGADQVLANRTHDLNEEMAKNEDQQIADGCPTSR